MVAHRVLRLRFILFAVTVTTHLPPPFHGLPFAYLPVGFAQFVTRLHARVYVPRRVYYGLPPAVLLLLVAVTTTSGSLPTTLHHTYVHARSGLHTARARYALPALPLFGYGCYGYYRVLVRSRSGSTFTCGYPVHIVHRVPPPSAHLPRLPCLRRTTTRGLLPHAHTRYCRSLPYAVCHTCQFTTLRLPLPFAGSYLRLVTALFYFPFPVATRIAYTRLPFTCARFYAVAIRSAYTVLPVTHYTTPHYHVLGYTLHYPTHVRIHHRSLLVGSYRCGSLRLPFAVLVRRYARAVRGSRLLPPHRYTAAGCRSACHALPSLVVGSSPAVLRLPPLGSCSSPLQLPVDFTATPLPVVTTRAYHVYHTTFIAFCYRVTPGFTVLVLDYVAPLRSRTLPRSHSSGYRLRCLRLRHHTYYLPLVVAVVYVPAVAVCRSRLRFALPGYRFGYYATLRCLHTTTRLHSALLPRFYAALRCGSRLPARYRSAVAYARAVTLLRTAHYRLVRLPVLTVAVPTRLYAYAHGSYLPHLHTPRIPPFYHILYIRCGSRSAISLRFGCWIHTPARTFAYGYRATIAVCRCYTHTVGLHGWFIHGSPRTRLPHRAHTRCGYLPFWFVTTCRWLRLVATPHCIPLPVWLRYHWVATAVPVTAVMQFTVAHGYVYAAFYTTALPYRGCYAPLVYMRLLVVLPLHTCYALWLLPCVWFAVAVPTTPHYCGYRLRLVAVAFTAYVVRLRYRLVVAVGYTRLPSRVTPTTRTVLRLLLRVYGYLPFATFRLLFAFTAVVLDSCVRTQYILDSTGYVTYIYRSVCVLVTRLYDAHATVLLYRLFATLVATFALHTPAGSHTRLPFACGSTHNVTWLVYLARVPHAVLPVVTPLLFAYLRLPVRLRTFGSAIYRVQFTVTHGSVRVALPPAFVLWLAHDVTHAVVLHLPAVTVTLRVPCLRHTVATAYCSLTRIYSTLRLPAPVPHGLLLHRSRSCVGYVGCGLGCHTPSAVFVQFGLRVPLVTGSFLRLFGYVGCGCTHTVAVAFYDTPLHAVTLVRLGYGWPTHTRCLPRTRFALRLDSVRLHILVYTYVPLLPTRFIRLLFCRATLPTVTPLVDTHIPRFVPPPGYRWLLDCSATHSCYRLLPTRPCRVRCLPAPALPRTRLLYTHLPARVAVVRGCACVPRLYIHTCHYIPLVTVRATRLPSVVTHTGYVTGLPHPRSALPVPVIWLVAATTFCTFWFFFGSRSSATLPTVGSVTFLWLWLLAFAFIYCGLRLPVRLRLRLVRGCSFWVVPFLPVTLVAVYVHTAAVCVARGYRDFVTGLPALLRIYLPVPVTVPAHIGYATRFGFYAHGYYLVGSCTRCAGYAYRYATRAVTHSDTRWVVRHYVYARLHATLPFRHGSYYATCHTAYHGCHHHISCTHLGSGSGWFCARLQFTRSRSAVTRLRFCSLPPFTHVLRV